MDSVPTLKEYLDYVHNAPGGEILALLLNAININRLLTTFLDELQQDDKVTASNACLLAWAVTHGVLLEVGLLEEVKGKRKMRESTDTDT